MRAEYDFFSCRKCHYSERAVISEHRTCIHPSIKAANFEGHGLDTFTAEDWKKLYFIVNIVLNLQITMVDNKIPNFDFPEKYDPVWITDCKGFKKSEHVKGHDHLQTKSFKNLVDEGMADG